MVLRYIGLYSWFAGLVIVVLGADHVFSLLRHGSNELDTFMLVSGKHCQARLDLIEPCLNYVTCQRALNTLLIKSSMALAAYLLSLFQVGQRLLMAGFFPIILSQQSESIAL
jgi:hypothetical protein